MINITYGVKKIESKITIRLRSYKEVLPLYVGIPLLILWISGVVSIGLIVPTSLLAGEVSFLWTWAMIFLGGSLKVSKEIFY